MPPLAGLPPCVEALAPAPEHPGLNVLVIDHAVAAVDAELRVRVVPFARKGMAVSMDALRNVASAELHEPAAPLAEKFPPEDPPVAVIVLNTLLPPAPPALPTPMKLT